MSVLTAGPWVMHSTDTVLRVWFRLDSAGTASVFAGGFSGSAAVDASTDFCGVVVLAGLTPSAEYEYTVEVDGVSHGPHRVRTMPVAGQPGAFRCYVIMDRHMRYRVASGTVFPNNGLVEEYYEKIAEFHGSYELPALCVTCGDFEIPYFGDLSTMTVANRRLGHAALRSYTFGSGEYEAIHAAMPTYNVWDDWDFLSNNSFARSGGSDKAAIAHQTWREYWMGSPATSPTGGIYQHWLVGDVLFVMLDNRSYRDQCPASANAVAPEVIPDASDWDVTVKNQVWGDEQLAWLLGVLDTYRAAPLKVIVNGCSIADSNWYNHTAERDSIGLWYRNQRNDLIAFLEANPDVAKGMIFVSGDNHCPAARMIDEWRVDGERDEVGDRADPDAAIAHTIPIPEWKATPVGDFSSNAGLAMPWADSPFDRFFGGGGPEANLEDIGNNKAFGVIDVDTAHPCGPQATFRLISPVTLDVLYEFRLADEDWYFPRGSHYLTADPADPINSDPLVISRANEYTEETHGADSYTAETAPLSPYSKLLPVLDSEWWFTGNGRFQTADVYDGDRSLLVGTFWNISTGLWESDGSANRELTGLVVGATYRVSAWINPDNSIDNDPIGPSCRLNVDIRTDPSVGFVEIARVNKSELPAGWSEVDFGTFVAPSSDLTFRFRSLGIGNFGFGGGLRWWSIDLVAQIGDGVEEADIYTPDAEPSTPWVEDAP